MQSDADLERFGKGLRKGLKTGIKVGLQAVGMFLVGEIKKDITKRSGGSKRATRYSPKRKVWVSPKGKSPNSDQGELRSSMAWQLMNNDQSVFVGSTVFNKAEILEDPNKLNRPFIKPMIEKKQQHINAILMRNMMKYSSKMNKARGRARGGS